MQAKVLCHEHMANSNVARITPQAKFCVVALSPYISRENYACMQLIATADMACLSLYHDEVNGSFKWSVYV